MAHQAKQVEFAVLYQNLQAENRRGNVIKIEQGSLSLFTYTNRCVYDRAWNEWNVLARGLILDIPRGEVIATPFPKFFNYGEMGIAPANEPFEVYEKLDGSLGIAYHHEGHWHIATKGSFDSAQAVWGTERLRSLDTSRLEVGATYLFEIVYGDNRIVVRYPFEGLVLLAAYDGNGCEFNHERLVQTSQDLGVTVAQKLDNDSIEDILERAAHLGRDSEGFVLRFGSGLRLKVKGEQYKRVHRLISGVTPLGIWDCLKSEDGECLESFRRDIPEEYWQDFDAITRLLRERLTKLVEEVEKYHEQHAHLSDKELGLILQSLPESARTFLFPRRKNRDWMRAPKLKDKLFAFIRPTDNCLPGYSESPKLSDVRLDA